jgi:exo-beta-1,3-glucanase (GH17 family)
MTAWAQEQGVPLFWFSAFDEPWKGSDHPDEIEKHWGLYDVDRRPKQAVSGGQDER